MSRSERKAAAARFRRHIRRSNELHVEYLEDASLLKAYDRFANWQLDYLLPFFSELYVVDGYAAAIDFVMSDLAGVGISSRDSDLERAAPAITTMLPLGALETIATAAEMNARVLKINIGICRYLLTGTRLPAEITEYEYCVACRKASSQEECVGLVHLITGLGETLKSLVKIPMIGITLRAMRAPARAAGFGALQDFLEKGYFTFRQIPDIDHFLSEIENRMVEVFERIYTAPLEQLR
ncbi:MAG: FFLEELY motif protein [Woeseiaceae bacterium]